jgi:hypothetical protein
LIPPPILSIFLAGVGGGPTPLASCVPDADMPSLSGTLLHPFEPVLPGGAPEMAGNPGAAPPVLVNTGSPGPGAAQNEPFLAVDPVDCFRLVASFNDYSTGDVRAGFAHSSDGGADWLSGLLIEPTHMAAGNTSVGADRYGNFFLGMVSFNRDPATGQVWAGIGSGVYVGASSDGGATWAGPFLVGPDTPTSLEDKPLLTVDTTGGPYDGSVHVVWTRFLDTNGVPTTYEQTQILYVGIPVGAPGVVGPLSVSDPSAPSGQGACPVVGPGSVLYCAWKAGALFYFDKSLDGGLTWGVDLPILPIVPLPLTLSPAVRVNSFPTLLVDASGGPFNGRLYVVWADYGNGDADVYCRRSTSGGLTWAPAVRVNDDPIANGKDQFLPWASVGRDGTLHVVFLDRRDDPANTDFRPYYASSTDGGVSFGANVALSASPSSPFPNFGGTFLGDYSGIASTGQDALPAWVDTTPGNQEIYATGVHAGVGALFPNAGTLSAAPGGSFNLCLAAGPSNAGRLYTLIGTASGTSPGILFNGIPIPINPDPITFVSISNPNNGLFVNFHHPLNAFGNGSAFLDVAPGLATPIVGMPLSLLYVLLNPIDLVSEVLTIDVAP